MIPISDHPPVAVLVPVLRRPHRVAPLVRSIKEATPGEHRILFLTDADDRAQMDAIAAVGAEFYCCGGSWAAKINVGLGLTDEPLIFTGADDLDFRPGWITSAAARMTETVGVVGVQDLCNPRTIRGEHATHFLVARWYAELGGIDGGGFAPEHYDHNFADNEILETAVHRGAYAFAPDAVVEHLHPLNGRAVDDEVYRKGQAHFGRDQRLFRRRRRLWA